jgi:anti-sigma-K factor RskA
MSEHEELENLVAAWVLGALDADEAAEISLHVEGCASCREMTVRLRRAVGALPLEVEEVAPPARLRERVLAAAAASRAATGAPVKVRPRAPRAAEIPRPILLRLRDRVPVYAAAAAVLVAVLVGLLAGSLIDRGTPPTASNPVARFTLAGHNALSGASGSVIDLKSDGVVLIDFRGLPALPPGKVYEVWLVTPGGHADPAAVFVPDSNGGKVVLVSRSLGGYNVMAVTSEAGPDGTNAPTQQPQLYGNLA